MRWSASAIKALIDLAAASGAIRFPSPRKYGCCGRIRGQGEPCAAERMVMAAAEAKRERKAIRRRWERIRAA